MARALAPCPGKEGLERGIPKELVSGQFAPIPGGGFSLWTGLLQESEPREACHSQEVRWPGAIELNVSEELGAGTMEEHISFSPSASWNRPGL